MLFQNHGKCSNVQLTSVNIKPRLNAHIPNFAVDFMDDKISEVYFVVIFCLNVLSLFSVVRKFGKPRCFIVTDYILVKSHWRVDAVCI